MPTLTLSKIRSLVRDEVQEATEISISDTELNNIINDGYRDTAEKGMCYEVKIPVTNILSSVSVVPIFGYNIIKVNYVEYDIGSSGCLGMICIDPRAYGHITIDGYSPQFWFRWGDYVVIDPLPDVATYDLNVYASCIPTDTMVEDSDIPTNIPTEFHECIFLYSISFVCMKLRRWGEAAMYYNQYIDSVQKKKFEYILKYPESRLLKDIPANVRIGK